MARSAVDRFTEKTRVSDTGCIEWTAYVGTNGYGRFYLDGRGVLAHRWAYEHYVGPIPDGLVIDHLCRNTKCVNPAHLEPVTISTNVLRGVGPAMAAERFSSITACPKGHPYDDQNTYNGGHGRTCLTCKRASARASYERTRDQVIERAREWRSINPDRARELARERARRRRAAQKAS